MRVTGLDWAFSPTAAVVLGENPYAEGAGDVRTLEYSPGDKRDLALLPRLRAAQVPVAHLRGR